MKKLKCIVIDDEEIDRLTAVSMLKRFDRLELLAAYANADDAMTDNDVYRQADVLFLDIDMEGTNGLEFRKFASEVPVCVFITSHPEYALDSYALDTLDYIMKPLSLKRFEATVARIDDFFELRNKVVMYDSIFSGGNIFIKEGTHETKIMLHEILYLEALKDYTGIVTESKKHYVLSSIGNVLKQKGFEAFVRTHKSYAVRRDIVKAVNYKTVVLQNDTEIPVGRNFKDNLNELYPAV